MARYLGINYIKQRRAGYCVAISILNALKWAGANVTENDLEHIYLQAGEPGGDRGTRFKEVNKALKRCKKYFISKYTKHPNSRTIKNWLKKNNAFILDYLVEETKNYEEGHSVFVLYDAKRDKFVVINDNGKTINYISEEKFKKMLKKTNFYHTGYYICKSTK